MINLNGWTKTALIATGVCLLALGIRATATDDKSATPNSKDAPIYKVDTSWPKTLPSGWIMGQVGDMAVDKDNHIWVFQRPKSNEKEDFGLDENVALCCTSKTPPVIEFDQQGNVLKSWGGPGTGYDWPSAEHGIYVDHAGNVWLTGSGRPDRMALKFSNDGKFIMQIGKSSMAPMANADTTMLGGAAGVEVDEAAHEVYFADGYLNRRVIVYDSDTGAFKRMWGAYGKPPSDEKIDAYNPNDPPTQLFHNPVHCVHLSKDGLVYVCDRSQDRIQVFTKQGTFQKEFIVRKGTVGMGSDYDLAFSHDPGQKYLLVADGEDGVVWIMRRSDGQVMGSFGHLGRGAAEFYHVHNIDADSSGNLYLGEVNYGKRVLRWTLVHDGK